MNIKCVVSIQTNYFTSVLQWMNVYVCLSTCLSQKTTRQKFTKFFIHAKCGRVSVPVWLQCDTVCISSFVNDVMFGHNLPSKSDANRVYTHKLLTRGRHCGRSLMCTVAWLVGCRKVPSWTNRWRTGGRRWSKRWKAMTCRWLTLYWAPTRTRTLRTRAASCIRWWSCISARTEVLLGSSQPPSDHVQSNTRGPSS